MSANTKDFAVSVAALLSSTRSAFAADERVGDLASALPTLDESPLRIALAGPFNAGKTMLIGAFLGLSWKEINELAAATPKTDEVTPYDWKEQILLDLPGTLSGLDEHDAQAAVGIRSADLLLLVTTVELPGEAETEQIHRLLAVEGFANRALVVVNKANSEESDREIVRAEIAARIADFPSVEVFFTDAKDYMDALNFPDLQDEDRELLREDSGIGELEAALGSLIASIGDLARLHATTHEVRRICEDAVRLWQPDNDEESLEVAADRIRLDFTNARTELAEATELALETLRNELIGIGTTLAAAVSEEDGSVTKQAAAAADKSEKLAAQQYEDKVSKAIDTVVARLVEQLGVTSHEWARYTTSSSNPSADPIAPKEQSTSGKRDDLVERLLDAGTKAIKGKLDAVLNGGVRPGSPAHDLARRINALLGRPPKPYTHVNMAENITTYGKRASTALQFIGPMADLKGIVDALRRSEKIKKQRAKIRAAYETHAEDVTRDERSQLDEHIEEVLAPLHNAVITTLSAAEDSSSARRKAQAAFGTLQDEASSLGLRIDAAISSARGLTAGAS